MMEAWAPTTRYGGISPDAFSFFLDNAGYCTPPGRVVCAAQLARAEYEGLARGFVVAWKPDDAGDCQCADCVCSRSGCECLGAVLMAREPEWVDERDAVWLSSLWGICGADAAYQRVVGAELMLDVLAPEWAVETLYDTLLARCSTRAR